MMEDFNFTRMMEYWYGSSESFKKMSRKYYLYNDIK